MITDERPRDPLLFDAIPIAVRAYTEPDAARRGRSLDEQIVSLITAPGDTTERIDRAIAQAAEDRERAEQRAADAAQRVRGREDHRGRREVRKAKRRLAGAQDRERRLTELGSLTGSERLDLAGELTERIIVAEQERRIKRLDERAEDDRRPVLFFDTETRITPDQRLMFGAWRLCEWDRDELVCTQEGLIVADDLTAREAAIIRDYAQRERMHAGTEEKHPHAHPVLAVDTEQEFVKRLYRCCLHPGPRKSASLVGLNINFDVSRLAVRWGASRSEKYQNGFSFQLHDDYLDPQGERRESGRLFPRYAAKHLASTKAMRGFVNRFSGHILDIRQLMFALTNSGHSLVSGCKSYGVPYAKREVELGRVYDDAITYCREDVEATHRLYEKVMLEYGRHPIPLQASQAYSPASVGKGYLAGMGIIPRLTRQPDFPREQLGIAMSAFYGGRTECKIRKTPVPVVYCDLMSAYPTGNSLMGLWDLVIAERVTLEDCTRDVRRLVPGMTLERCLDPEAWRDFPALVQIQPDGDVLPVRGRYTETNWNIGSNHLHSDQPLWFSLPDIIASRLITGRAPKILKAIRLTAHGVQDGLRPISLRGEIEVDPREDFFRTVIEQRHRLTNKKSDLGEFLKTLANSSSYGVYAEMIRSELAPDHFDEVLLAGYEGETKTIDTHAPERPGSYFFAPMAAVITGATRLLLAIAETLVTQAGGTWAMCDTDSMAIVANRDGRLIPCPGGSGRLAGQPAITALSWAQVDAITDRLRSLNPYRGPAAENSVFELEDENLDLGTGERRQLYCYSISSKRYCLYNLTGDGEPIIRGATSPDQHPEQETADRAEIRKRSDHGLGYLINPVDPDSGNRDWIADGWEWIVRDALGLRAPEPAWFKRPAMMRVAVSKPRLLSNFDAFNAGKPWRRQMRPFNFAMAARQQSVGIVSDPDELAGEDFITGPCALIAPLDSRPERWCDLTYINHYQPGSSYRISTAPFEGRVTVRTLRDVFEGYRGHAEPKALGPDEHPCRTDDAVGLLGRRTVHPSSIKSIGKEVTELDERLTGLRQDEAELVNSYTADNRQELTRQVILTLGEPVGRTAELAGVSARTVKQLRAGRSVNAGSIAKLSLHARKEATRALRASGVLTRTALVGEEAILYSYLHHFKRLCDCGCGRPVTGRRRYHEQACRSAAHRDRQRLGQAP